jgi:hypothetical protein
MLASDLAALDTRDLSRLLQQLEAFPDTATLWQTRAGITNAGDVRNALLRLFAETQTDDLPYVG